jgi:hypothetical protein
VAGVLVIHQLLYQPLLEELARIRERMVQAMSNRPVERLSFIKSRRGLMSRWWSGFAVVVSVFIK